MATIGRKFETQNKMAGDTYMNADSGRLEVRFETKRLG
jgi:hypothetical protein